MQRKKKRENFARRKLFLNYVSYRTEENKEAMKYRGK